MKEHRLSWSRILQLVVLVELVLLCMSIRVPQLHVLKRLAVKFMKIFDSESSAVLCKEEIERQSDFAY